MKTQPRLHPVILAGGSGVRFWPLSRRARPKQLLPLTSAKPLVVETASRLEGICEEKDILTICGSLHAEEIRRVLPGSASGILVEPVPRNTAAAIGLAATVVASRDPEGVLAVLPSDHAILDRAAFRSVLLQAAETAAKGPIVAIGIDPTRPETGFGYIRIGDDHPYGGKRIDAFVEKPTRDRAEDYLRTGNYLWNAGMFVFRADRMLEELERHLPACKGILDRIAPYVDTPNFEGAMERWFHECPSISIDYAVMEKAEDLAVIPADFGWSDLGSFASIPEVRDADSRGNVASEDSILIDAERNVVVGDGQRLVALVGCSDLVVVDTDDALLICAADRAQEIRKVVEELEARGEDALL